jgi:hypothetical protein
MRSNTTTVDFSTKLVIAKLVQDKSNWPTYHDDIINACKARGVYRHLIGNCLAPSDIDFDEKDGKYYILSADLQRKEEVKEVDAHKMIERLELYKRREAQVREIIRQTVNESLWAQIRDAGEPDDIWRRLSDMCQKKPLATIQSIHDRMRTLRCTAGRDPNETISQLLAYLL